MPARDLRDILYLTHRVPYPPDKGDRIRTYHILRFLAGRARVHLACLADEPVPATAHAELERYCPRVAVVPLGVARWWHGAVSFALGSTLTEGVFHAAAFGRLIKDWCRATPFSAALASSSSLVPYLRNPALRGVPAVVDLMDVDSQKWLDFAGATRGPRSWLYRTEGRRLRKLEAILPGEFHAVTLVSAAEAELCRQFCASGRVEAIPNGVDLDYFQPSQAATEPACVFVGALDYRPNVDGIDWFCRRVWPGVLQGRPATKLYVVGRRPVKTVRELSRLTGVEVVGTVPDVRPYLHRARVAIVPLRLARGVQNKVLESLALGKPTVAAPPALAALGVEPGIHLLTASSAADWEAAVLRLLDDEPFGRQLGAAGRRYTEDHHAWDRCLEPLAALLGLEPIMPARAGP